MEHKCADCGFLAIRNKETRNLEEVEYESRQNGKIHTGIYHYLPTCFEMVVNFPDEIDKLKQLPRYQEQKNSMGEIIWPQYDVMISETINAERECQFFAHWQQGFTPKEHRDMLDREWQQKHQEEREDKLSKVEGRRNIFVGVLGIVAVIVGVILGHFIK